MMKTCECTKSSCKKEHEWSVGEMMQGYRGERPEPKTTKIPPRKLKESTITNAAMVGSAIILIPMGDTLKFTLKGIKYTFIRQWEE